MRVAVGAAVVLFIAAVATAAVLSFAASGGGAQGTIAAATGASTPRAASARGRPRGPTSRVPPMLVHVLGAVARPGLVELDQGARVVDAVAAAGGFTADADPAGVNLARPWSTASSSWCSPSARCRRRGSAAGGAAARLPTALVHLNTADVAALDTLPRIGPALAQRIIDWREANGPFTSVDQLLEVAGIGDAVFSGLADRVAP